MKNFITILIIFISVSAYSQTNKNFSKFSQGIDDNQDIIAEYNLECIGKNKGHSSSVPEINQPNIIPRIQCPKRIQYKLAPNLTLNGLNKVTLTLK